MSSDPITIKFLPPTDLTGYNRFLTADEQPPNIPKVFIDAMTVREEVFVKGQGVPLSMEADVDDARSCHWIAYTLPSDPALAPIPVGTIRLVPFPHDPHPLPGSSWDIPEEAQDAEPPSLEAAKPPYIVDRVTSLHDGKEPYIKFGRVATVPEYRGRGIANLLVSTAIEWATQNPTFFNSKVVVTGAGGEELNEHRTKWNGLICVHSQEYVANAYLKWGFVVDEGMGKWTEAGIPHVGMFLRVNINLPAH